MIRQEIIEALRAEADRIEAGERTPDPLSHSVAYGWKRGGDKSLEHFRRDCFYDGMWSNEALSEHHWGVYVPVRGPRIVKTWETCARCDGDEFSYQADYCVVTLLGHVEPEIPEQLESCDGCAEDEVNE